MWFSLVTCYHHGINHLVGRFFGIVLFFLNRCVKSAYFVFVRTLRSFALKTFFLRYYTTEDLRKLYYSTIIYYVTQLPSPDPASPSAYEPWPSWFPPQIQTCPYPPHPGWLSHAARRKRHWAVKQPIRHCLHSVTNLHMDRTIQRGV